MGGRVTGVSCTTCVGFTGFDWAYAVEVCIPKNTIAITRLSRYLICSVLQCSRKPTWVMTGEADGKVAIDVGTVGRFGSRIRFWLRCVVTSVCTGADSTVHGFHERPKNGGDRTETFLKTRG